jgi:hypothetical protein
MEHPYHHLSLLRKRLVRETKEDEDRKNRMESSYHDNHHQLNNFLDQPVTPSPYDR